MNGKSTLNMSLKEYLKRVFLWLGLWFWVLLVVSCKPAEEAMRSKPLPDRRSGDSVTSAGVAITGMYIDAVKEKIIGNFVESDKMLKECLKLDPANDAAWFQLADISQITGEYANALHYVDKAVAFDPHNVWYLALRADLLMKMGQYDDAVKVFGAINLLKPEKKIWWEAKAYTQNAGGDTKGAIHTWQYILDEWGFDEVLFFKMLDATRKVGNAKQTEQSLQWLIGKFPYETKYMGLLAAFYVEQKKPGKAMALWNEILRIEPGNGEVHFELANHYRSRGEDQKAFDELLLAFGSPNLNIDAKIAVLISYYDLTEKYPEMLDEAYQLLEITVKQHPENPKGWSMYADYLFRQGQNDRALKMFIRVVELDSTKYVVWEQLLNTAGRLNDFETLRIQSEKALRLFPDQAPLYLNRGIGLLYDLEFVEAIETLNKGYFFTGFSDTISSEILHQMARAYELSGDLKMAAKYYNRAVDKGFAGWSLFANRARFVVLYNQQNEIQEKGVRYPEDLRVSLMDPLMNLTQLWMKVSDGTDPATIRGELSALDKLSADHYTAMEHTGDLYWHLGMKTEAFAAWERALQLSKGNTWLQNKLENNKP